MLKKSYILIIMSIFLLSSFVFGYKPDLVLTNQTVLNSTETAYIFNDPSNVAVNNKVKLKDHQYLEDKEKNKQYYLSYKVPKKSRALKFDKIVARANNKYDFKVSTIEGSSIDFHLVDDNITIKNISINRYEGLPTEVARVDNITLDYATVTLAKTYDTYISHILHSEDGVNFEKTNMTFEQNKTHIWFNTSHFSSFTGSIPNFELIIGDVAEQFDINDYATIDTGHYVKLFLESDGSTTSISNKDISGFVEYRVENAFGDPSFEVVLTADHEVQLSAPAGIPFYAEPYDDDITACIYTAGDSLEDCDTFNVYVRDFDLPSCPSAVSETDITKTSATLRGRIYFNDFTGTVEGKLGYREFGSSDPFNYNSYSAISDGVIFTRPISGLTSDTTYESLTSYRYTYESSTYTQVCDVTGLFATLADIDPFVTTLSASDVGETSATLRGLPDKGDFTGTVQGRFYYKKVSDSTWTSTTLQTITDDTTYTQGISGLTTDENYHYYAEVTWTDGGTQTATGSTIIFKPKSAGASTILFEDYFNRSNSNTVGNGWTESESASTDIQISSETITLTRSTGAVYASQSLSSFTTEDLNFEIDIKFTSVGSQTGSIFLYSNSLITVYTYVSSSYPYCQQYNGGSPQQKQLTGAGTVNANEWYNLTIKNIDWVNYDYDVFINGTLAGNCEFSSHQGQANIQDIRYFHAAAGQTTTSDSIKVCDGACSEAIEITDPTTTTLSPTNINQSNATLRGIADFATFNGSVYGTFQYKLNSTSTWTNDGDVVNPISNDTIFSYTIGGLTSNTQYDFRSVLTWFDGESKNAFGEMISFNTSKVGSILTQQGTDNILDTSARLAFNITFNDVSWVNYIISWDEYSAILGGSPVWNNIGPTNITSEGFQYYNLTGLTSGTKYGYYVSYQDDTGVKYSDIIDFTPGSANIPQLGSVLFSNIKRTTADADVEVTSLGVYEQFLLKGYLSYADENNWSENISEVITSVGNYTFPLQNLTINQSYDVIYEILYDDGIYNTSKYYFETLSLADTIPPSLGDLEVSTQLGEFTLDIEIEMNEQDVAGLRFNILGYLNETYPNGLLTSYVEINESQNYSITFTNIALSNLSARAELRYYNGTLPTPGGPIQPEFYDYIFTDYETFLVQEGPIEAKCFEMLPWMDICVEQPYLFVVLMINGFILLGLGFSIAGETLMSSKLNEDFSAINTFVLYVTLATTVFALVWLKLQSLIPTWQMILTITGLAVIITYSVLEARK